MFGLGNRICSDEHESEFVKTGYDLKTHKIDHMFVRTFNLFLSFTNVEFVPKVTFHDIKKFTMRTMKLNIYAQLHLQLLTLKKNWIKEYKHIKPKLNSLLFIISI